jgi:nitroreductase
MEFMKLIEERHSTRVYAQTPVEQEKLDAILHAANRAPSAGDLQAYSIAVVRRRDVCEALARASGGQDWLALAPLILVFVAEPGRSAVKYGRRGENLYAVQDATIACAYAQLAAHDVGLSACWIGAFRTSDVQALVGLREGQVPVALLAIGYAAEAPFVTPRRPLSDLAREV